MPLSCLLAAWKHVLPCLLLSLIMAGAIADGPSSVSKSTSDRATATKDTDDPFVGDYIGTVHPLGEYSGTSKPKDDRDFKPQSCGSCHTEATIERSGGAYSLVMLVDHGKDKEGKLKRDRYTLKAERHDKTLSFSNEACSITVAGDEATGNRLGRMAAEIKLKRAPVSGGKPDADESPSFDIATKKPNDAITMKIKGDTAAFDVFSQSGIGGGTITLTKGKWPTTVVLRLHLRGLESFSASNGKVSLKGSVASHSGNPKRLYLTEEGKAENREPGTEIRVLDPAGKPVKGLPDKGGYFEIKLPKALLEGEPKSLELGWIDFYRR